MAILHSFLAITALLGATTQAQVVGSAFGFAAGTTGGGDATPEAPADTAQLAEWLADDTPRVILIDKEFNFLGDECVDCACCIPSSNTCGSAGQNAIEVGIGWCDSSPKTTCTYDNAGLDGLDVGSDKSIVGVGTAGVIRGKGLRLHGGVSNIIIQNIHITELNPQYIWGGDAISLDGTDKVWIDHVKVSLVGRQMLVTGFESSGSVTVSNSEFDGQTDWSASCDGHHYWTILALGTDDKVTFAYNYIHQTSGRAPKLGYPNFWHVYNNYWYDNTGHAIDVAEDSNTLVEGNVFEEVKNAYNGEGAGSIFVVDSDSESTCSSALGRTCVANLLVSSEATAVADEAVLSSYPSSDEGTVSIMPADQVAAYVLANAGVGKLGSGSSVPTSSVIASPSTVVTPTPTPTPINLGVSGSSTQASGEIGSVTPIIIATTTTASIPAIPTPAPTTTWTTIAVSVPSVSTPYISPSPIPTPSSSSIAVLPSSASGEPPASISDSPCRPGGGYHRGGHRGGRRLSHPHGPNFA